LAGSPDAQFGKYRAEYRAFAASKLAFHQSNSIEKVIGNHCVISCYSPLGGSMRAWQNSGAAIGGLTQVKDNIMRASHNLAVALLITSTGTAAAATLTVGNGDQYATLPAAVAASSNGDTIDVYANATPYTDEYVTITKNLTIDGIGTTPVFTQTPGTEIGNLMGFLVIQANVTVQNLSFQDASISLNNGDNAAGIRFQSGSLTVIDSSFIGNQNGILATPFTAGTGTVTVTNSTFTDNGVATGPSAGLEHGIYVNQVALFTFTGNTVTGTQVGSDVKSRAGETILTGNTLEEGITGTASYAADFSNGGIAVFSGNTVNQGSNTGNNSMVAYGAEGLDYSTNSLLVSGNTFNSSDTSGVPTGINNFTTTVNASVTCNAFNGVTNLTSGPATLSGNVINGPLPACTTASVPEPSSAAGLLTGMVGLLLAMLVRRRTI
jgi:hypothetical protein